MISVGEAQADNINLGLKYLLISSEDGAGGPMVGKMKDKTFKKSFTYVQTLPYHHYT